MGTIDEQLYPINLRLAGRRVLVVGGGNVAEEKVRTLVPCDARIDVVAPSIRESLASMSGVVTHHRPYRSGEVGLYRMAITATDDPQVNQQVFDEGESAGVWVNSADDPDNCAFTLPSRVRRNDLLVSFSTRGRSPALSTWLRRRFDEEFGPEYDLLIDILAEERMALRMDGVKVPPTSWQTALDSGMLELIRAGQVDEARELLVHCLRPDGAPEPAPDTRT